LGGGESYTGGRKEGKRRKNLLEKKKTEKGGLKEGPTFRKGEQERSLIHRRIWVPSTNKRRSSQYPEEEDLSKGGGKDVYLRKRLPQKRRGGERGE